MAVHCPHCQLLLTNEEATTGKCPSCQGIIGTHATAAAPPGAWSSPAPRRRSSSGLGCLIAVIIAVPVVLSLLCLGGGIWLLVLNLNETAWQKNTAEGLKKLPFGGPAEGGFGKVPIRDKVLVWDCTNSTLSAAQSLLRADRRATKVDDAFTVILILHNNDKVIDNYSNGAQAIQRTLTIGVVDFPEKKTRGSFQVAGEVPPLMVQRNATDRSPIIGDTTGPLKTWIESKGGRPHGQ